MPPAVAASWSSAARAPAPCRRASCPMAPRSASTSARSPPNSPPDARTALEPAVVVPGGHRRADGLAVPARGAAAPALALPDHGMLAAHGDLGREDFLRHPLA